MTPSGFHVEDPKSDGTGVWDERKSGYGGEKCRMRLIGQHLSVDRG